MPTPLADLDMPVRLATPRDGPGLLALTRACPMQADISLMIEREPNFFALSDARGTSTTVVATEADAIIACASVARRPAWIDGEPAEMGVIADLKVHPERRGRGLGQALLDAIAALHADLSPAVYVGLTAEGNGAVDTVVHRFGEGRALRVLGRFVSLQLLPLWPLAVRDDVETVTQSAVAAFLDEVHRPVTFAPRFADTAFPGTYRVVREGSAIVAALGEWDAHAIKTTRVVGMPWTLRALSAVMGVASKVLPTAPLPTVGEPLRFPYLRHAAHRPGHEAALDALVRERVNAARARGDHFALFTAAADDPLIARYGRLPHTRYTYRLVAGVNRAEAEPLLDRLVGQALYDDAALA